MLSLISAFRNRDMPSRGMPTLRNMRRRSRVVSFMDYTKTKRGALVNG
jgi:hypothetical protein